MKHLFVSCVAAAVFFATSPSGDAYAQLAEASGSARALLRERRFADLEQLVASTQNRYLADHRVERELDLLLDQFYRPLEWMNDPLNAWVESSGSPHAFLGRGIYYTAMGWDRRGAAFARETTKTQVKGMREYFELAVADFAKVVEAQPEQVHVYCYLIDIVMNFSNDEVAADYLQRALSVNPLSLTARWYYVTSVQPIWGGSVPQMEKVIEEARLRYDDNQSLRLLEGRVDAQAGNRLITAGSYAEAIEKYTAAIERGGEHALYYLGRGQASLRARQLDAGITDLDRALQLRPDYGLTLMYRGWGYVLRGEYERAVDDLTKAIEFGQGDDDFTLSTRAQAYAHLKRYDEARADLQRAAELNPSNERYVQREAQLRAEQERVTLR